MGNTRRLCLPHQGHGSPGAGFLREDRAWAESRAPTGASTGATGGRAVKIKPTSHSLLTPGTVFHQPSQPKRQFFRIMGEENQKMSSFYNKEPRLVPSPNILIRFNISPYRETPLKTKRWCTGVGWGYQAGAATLGLQAEGR